MILNSSVYKITIKTWARYVDDVLIIQDGDIGQIKYFMKELNNAEKDNNF